SITDPDNNFLETNDSNNWAAVPIAITMQHNPLPATPINLVAASGLTYTFSFNNTDVTSWTWNFGDGGTDTLNNPATHTYAAPGTYTVTVIMTNPCGSITSTQVIMITGMEEQGNFSAVLLKANPNPADGTTTISFMMPESGAMQLEVYNLLGERVAVLDQGSKSQGWHNTTLDFDALGLSNGAYFIRLVTPAHYSVLRVIKN
ncbi:MAG TPA: PKD domain-containing protein, partial [Bacteroidia bacterium]|nr:PKD domain-containing protein [Bacteroidia bacterium]